MLRITRDFFFLSFTTKFVSTQAWKAEISTANQEDHISVNHVCLGGVDSNTSLHKHVRYD